MTVSLVDIECAFKDLRWSYVRAPDGKHILTEFSDHIAPVRMVISVENNSLVIRTLGVERVSFQEMGEILKLARDLDVSPPGFTWSRDPEDNEAWCTIVQPMSSQLASGWLSNEIDKVVLAVHAFRTTVPRVRRRRNL